MRWPAPEPDEGTLAARSVHQQQAVLHALASRSSNGATNGDAGREINQNSLGERPRVS